AGGAPASRDRTSAGPCSGGGLRLIRNRLPPVPRGVGNERVLVPVESVIRGEVLRLSVVLPGAVLEVPRPGGEHLPLPMLGHESAQHLCPPGGSRDFPTGGFPGRDERGK